MDYLPFLPKERESWLASLLLTFIFFWGYYVWGGYTLVFERYMSGFHNPDPQPFDHSRLSDLEIEASIPKYNNPAVRLYAYLELYNNHEENSIKGIWVWIDVEEPDNENDGPSKLPIVFDPYLSSEEIGNSAIYIEEILPKNGVKLRIPLNLKELVSQGAVSGNPEIYIGFEDGDGFYYEAVSAGNPPPPIEVRNAKAFRQSLFEVLMMPPWANGIIPLLVLFLSGLSESIITDNRPEEPRERQKSDFLIYSLRQFSRTGFLLIIYLSCVYLFIIGQFIWAIVITIVLLGVFWARRNPRGA